MSGCLRLAGAQESVLTVDIAARAVANHRFCRYDVSALSDFVRMIGPRFISLHRHAAFDRKGTRP